MWELQPDRDAAGALGETLRGLGYDEDAIEDRLGEDGAAAEAGDAVVYPRRLPNDELDDAIRLLPLPRRVATDINPRALAFTQISAALNDIDNVETRLGSLFEPVAGETFGLITCNAPYVISPKARWQYRDAGFPGDEFSRLVVTSAAAHLE